MKSNGSRESSDKTSPSEESSRSSKSWASVSARFTRTSSVFFQESATEPITQYPEDDERYALFAYLGSLAEWYGADRETYVTLPTEYKHLKNKVSLDTMEMKDEFGQTALHIAAQYCTGEPVFVE